MFDVQMMGGIVLHEGDIAEMKTGEGKTFVASTALYLNALPATGVHLVTVNDYLAKRDAEWNRGVFERLGMTVGFIQNMMPFDRAQAGLRGRRHLRHQLRVRLRLPPRQHGRLARQHRAAQPRVRDRGRGRLDPDRRGTHAADHLRRARDGGEHVLRLRPDREGASTASRRPARRPRARTRPSCRAPTTSTTRSTRPSRRRRPRWTRSSARSGSRTSTTRATCSSSTTSARRSRPSRCTSATSTT